jgi:predicted GIY-YIG superfamily endonuclease
VKYVYLLESIPYPAELYVGLADDLRARMKKHDSGGSPHTSKFEPWRLITYLAFSNPQRAVQFERYMKTHSGRAFAKKRLR